MTPAERPALTSAPGTTALARHLAEIARVLLVPGTVAQALERIVAMAVATIEGCDEAGLTGGAALDDLAASTTAVVAQLTQLQETVGEGPCRVVVAGQESVHVPDLADDGRWPSFAPAAVGLGIRSALAFRVFAGAETLGALQLYGRLPGAFNASARAEGLLFAAYAGMALALARAQALDQGRIDHLQTALVSRELIGQAQGILMNRERITAEQAFVLLRRSSQHLNRKLRDVAQDVVDTGGTPQAFGPPDED